MHYFSLLRKVIVWEAVVSLLWRTNWGCKKKKKELKRPIKIISHIIYPLLPYFWFCFDCGCVQRGAGRANTIHQTCFSFMSFVQWYVKHSMHFWSCQNFRVEKKEGVMAWDKSQYTGKSFCYAGEDASVQTHLGKWIKWLCNFTLIQKPTAHW